MPGFGDGGHGGEAGGTGMGAHAHEPGLGLVAPMVTEPEFHPPCLLCGGDQRGVAGGSRASGQARAGREVAQGEDARRYAELGQAFDGEHGLGGGAGTQAMVDDECQRVRALFGEEREAEAVCAAAYCNHGAMAEWNSIIRC